MSSNIISTDTAQLRCLCGAICEPGSLLDSATFPVESELCHCNVCRYTTGALCLSGPLIKSAPSALSLSRLTAYPSSNAINRHFCSTCGSHCFIEVFDNGWFVCSGIIEQTPENSALESPWLDDFNPVTTTQHDFLDDTGDGGIAPYLLNLSGRSIPCHDWNSSTSPSSEPVAHSVVRQRSRKSHASLASDARLSAKCHCGAINLLISRADFSHPIPGVPATHVPRDQTKYQAHFCACRSCRLACGVLFVHAWSFVPSANIAWAQTGEPVIFERKGLLLSQKHQQPTTGSGTKLMKYWSSCDSCRAFCGSCGAAVFYWCDDDDDEHGIAMVDVSVGLLRAEEGALARNWLEWEWGRVSHWKEGGGEVFNAVLNARDGGND